MLKYIIYICFSFLFLLIFLFSECKGQNVNVVNLRPIKDSVIININLYECNEHLDVILDSTIATVTNCPLYNDINIEFLITVYLNERGDTIISIENVPLWNIPNYTGCKGFFYYKEYRFYYFGIFLSSFFVDTNKNIEKQIAAPEDLTTDIDDTGSYWYYLICNGELKCISYQNCKNWWIDVNYIPVEESE